MITVSTLPPPLSPVLLAGLAARPIPLAILQPFLKMAMQLMMKRHKDVFDRLNILDKSIFVIDPTDLPFVFILETCGASSRLSAAYAQNIEGAKATIRGPLAALIELLEGRTDGDAIFFNRTLVVEGDIEAVLTLRNAVDGADINLLNDVLLYFGPFKPIAEKIHNKLASVAAMAAEDLELLRSAITGPVIKRSNQQANAIRKMEEQIGALQKENKRLEKAWLRSAK